MKKTISILFGLTIISAIAATDVKLAWDASCSPNLTGYRLYYGNIDTNNYKSTNITFAFIDDCSVYRPASTNIRSGNYTYSIFTTNTTATASNLNPGLTYYFSVTSLNTAGLESDYSSEVSYTTPIIGAKPMTVIIKISP